MLTPQVMAVLFECLCPQLPDILVSLFLLLFYPAFISSLGQWVGLVQATPSLLKTEDLELIFALKKKSIQ